MLKHTNVLSPDTLMKLQEVCVGLTKKELSWKVGVSGVPWL